MGVREHAPDAMQPIDIQSFAGKRVAVDSNIFLGRFFRIATGPAAGIAGDPGASPPATAPAANNIPTPANHLLVMERFANWLLANGLKPLFVFDGERKLAEKQVELNRRQMLRDQALQEREAMQQVREQAAAYMRILENAKICQEGHPPTFAPPTLSISASFSKPRAYVLEWERSLRIRVQEHFQGTIGANLRSELLLEAHDLYLRAEMETSRLAARSVAPTIQDAHACKQLLTSLGHLVLESPHEGEALCCALTSHQLADATLSDDADCLLFGNGIMLKDVYRNGRPAVQIDPRAVKQHLQLSDSQFLDMCILCGTDFSGTVSLIGPERALSFLQKYGSLEKVLEAAERGVLGQGRRSFQPSPSFNHQAARSVFQAKLDVSPYEHRIHSHIWPNVNLDNVSREEFVQRV